MRYGTMRELSVVPGGWRVGTVVEQPVWAGYTDRRPRRFAVPRMTV